MVLEVLSSRGHMRTLTISLRDRVPWMALTIYLVMEMIKLPCSSPRNRSIRIYSEARLALRERRRERRLRKATLQATQ